MVQSQLVGSRGVVKLKPGYQYRDKYTVSASEQVANFAKKFQPFDDNNAQGRRSRTISVNQVEYHTATSENKAGRKVANNQIFDFQSSREISPLAELRTNQPLEEIEIERSTSPSRLLPGQKDTHHRNSIGRVYKTRGKVSKTSGRVSKTSKVSTYKRVPAKAVQ